MLARFVRGWMSLRFSGDDIWCPRQPLRCHLATWMVENSNKMRLFLVWHTDCESDILPKKRWLGKWKWKIAKLFPGLSSFLQHSIPPNGLMFPEGRCQLTDGQGKQTLCILPFDPVGWYLPFFFFWVYVWPVNKCALHALYTQLSFFILHYWFCILLQSIIN